jgi:hypothetical protein
MGTLIRVAINIIGASLLLLTLAPASNAAPIFPTMTLVFPVDTLVGYTGGALCSLSNKICANLVTGLLTGPGSQLCGSPVSDCAQNASFAAVLPTGTFDLSGTLSDGAVFTGAMSLDEVTGTVASASVSISPPDSLILSAVDSGNADTASNGEVFWTLGLLPPTTIPEPGTLPLMVIGLAAAIALVGGRDAIATQRRGVPAFTKTRAAELLRVGFEFAGQVVKPLHSAPVRVLPKPRPASSSDSRASCGNGQRPTVQRVRG